MLHKYKISFKSLYYIIEIYIYILVNLYTYYIKLGINTKDDIIIYIYNVLYVLLIFYVCISLIVGESIFSVSIKMVIYGLNYNYTPRGISLSNT